jgi:integrase
MNSSRTGVRAKGTSRIQLDFNYAGTRYRPTTSAAPTESNLQRARSKLKRVKVRIANGTFSFAAEFPNYRYRDRLARSFSTQTCNDVFDAYLAHCAARLAKLDLAYATLASYRRVIDWIWHPMIGARRFDQVNYSMLVKIADAKHVGKKTYKNIVSVLRRAFEHGYRDHPERHNPARGLKTLRMHRKDRPPVDPFSIEEAEALIAAIHRDWGEAQGNYDEFRFFTGLRPSEEIALLVSDCDLERGTIAITKARVMARDKDRTKTSEDRTVALCVAKQHGHSAHLMLDVYANWIEATDASEIARIEQAMQPLPASWHQHGTSAERPYASRRSTGKYVAEREGFELADFPRFLRISIPSKIPTHVVSCAGAPLRVRQGKSPHP